MSIPVNTYPYTDLHEMNMDWVVQQVQTMITAWGQTETEWHNTQEEWTALYNYVHDYFDNLDVTQEVQNVIDQMIIDGTLQPIIAQVVSQVYDTVPTQGSTMPVQSGGVYNALIQNWHGAVHNGIYRGKNLGILSTSQDFEDFCTVHAIASGDFIDLYLGDFVTINSVIWVVASFDHYFGKGVPTQTLDHHVTFITMSDIGAQKMNASASTSGGYVSSSMFATLATIASGYASIVGSHFCDVSQLLSNATSGGKASGWIDRAPSMYIPCEVEICGYDSIGNNYDIGIGQEKLALFNFISPNAYTQTGFWFRDVSSSTDYGFYGAGGYAGGVAANTDLETKVLMNIK